MQTSSSLSAVLYTAKQFTGPVGLGYFRSLLDICLRNLRLKDVRDMLRFDRAV